MTGKQSSSKQHIQFIKIKQYIVHQNNTFVNQYRTIQCSSEENNTLFIKTTHLFIRTEKHIVHQNRTTFCSSVRSKVTYKLILTVETVSHIQFTHSEQMQYAGHVFWLGVQKNLSPSEKPQIIPDSLARAQLPHSPYFMKFTPQIKWHSTFRFNNI